MHPELHLSHLYNGLTKTTVDMTLLESSLVLSRIHTTQQFYSQLFSLGNSWLVQPGDIYTNVLNGRNLATTQIQIDGKNYVLE